MGNRAFLGGLFAALFCVCCFSAEFDKVRTFTAGEAIATAGLRVKLSGVTVVKSGAGEDDIGSVIAPVASGGPVGVKLARTGTSTMIANGIIAAGTAVYGAAAGKVASAVTGHRIGYILTASAADGDEVEVLRLPFTLSTLGDITVEAGKNLTAGAGVGAVDFSTMSGTFATPTGAGTLSGTTNVAANKNLTCSAGTTALDFSLGTGVFKTPSGAGTLSGDTTVAAGKFIGVTNGGSATVSTGDGSIKMSTATAGPTANSKWIPIQYAGVTYYVPAWTTHAP
jgi:hypothetical protein